MSIRRVSSRQRLVSWDAFDASTVSYDFEEEEEEENPTNLCQEEVETRSNYHHRVVSPLPLLSSSSSSLSSSSSSSKTSLPTLMSLSSLYDRQLPTATAEGAAVVVVQPSNNEVVVIDNNNNNNSDNHQHHYYDTTAVVHDLEQNDSLDLKRKRRCDTACTPTATTTTTTTTPSASTGTTTTTATDTTMVVPIEATYNDAYHHHHHSTKIHPHTIAVSATTIIPNIDAGSTTTSPLMMERGDDLPTISSLQLPTVIPMRHSNQNDDDTIRVHQLPIEIQCIIYQYLTLPDLRSMTQVCQTLRQLLLLVQPPPPPPHFHNRDNCTYVDTNSDNHYDTEEACIDSKSNSNNDGTEEMNCIVESALWKPLCINQYWPFLLSQSEKDTISDQRQKQPWIIGMTTPTTATSQLVLPNRKDYSMILSMAIRNVPTHIDATLFPTSMGVRGLRNILLQHQPTVVDRHRRQQQQLLLQQLLRPKLLSIQCNVITTVISTVVTTNGNNTISTQQQQQSQQQLQVIQFTGTIGIGDQCIRSNAPFPRPNKYHRTSTATTTTPTKQLLSNNNNWKSIILLNRNAKHHHQSTSSTLFQRVFRNTTTSGDYNDFAATGTTTAAAVSGRRAATDGRDGHSSNHSLFCPLRRSARIAAAAKQLSSSSTSKMSSVSHPYDSISRSHRSSYRPFCVPYITKRNEINIAPRYIAYYEVTILPLPQRFKNNISRRSSSSSRSNNNNMDHTDDDDNSDSTTIISSRTNGTTTITTSIHYPPPPQPDASLTTSTDPMMDRMIHRNENMTTNANNDNDNTITTGEGRISDCVAIGVGTERFPMQHRMPGWDNNSYGYHGDDGGIFHGNGSMIQQYNRKFGTNDTIGCGIDYIQNSIFFTLNGIFLGYAFPLCQHHIDIDLYPIIGMDTQYPIICNFGQQPYAFDLQFMIEQQL